MKKIAIVFVLFWSTAVGAVPNTINFTGRLTTSTGPVTGSVNVTLKLFDVASGGTALWTEIHNNVGADNGLVFVDAGTLTTLDEMIFDGRRLYFEVVVGAETLAPRLAVNSVPYAMRTAAATNADFLGASIGPGDVVTSVNGNGGVVTTKAGNAVAVSLSTTGCANGQVFKYNGTTFACGVDLNTTYTGGTGVSVAGTTISLATTGCAVGFVWKYNGTTFACAPDVDTTYTAGAGVSIAGTTIALSTTGCATGSVWKYNGTAFSCQPDANTTYTGGAGVSVAGTTISVDSTLVARKDAAAGNQVFDTNTLFLDYTNNRVGVGTATPTAPLDVAGAVRATDFQYSGPVTGHAMALPNWCTRAGAAVARDANSVFWTPPVTSIGPAITDLSKAANSVTSWLCPVQLEIPPGSSSVTITGMTMAFYDFDSTCRVQADLRFKTFGPLSIGSVIATINSGADSADFVAALGATTKAVTGLATNISFNTVVWVNATVAQNTVGSGLCAYSGVLIDYAVTHP